ncbi:MAG: hypothetical protein AAFO72_08015 [Pseudomonadota bacterium]
MTDKPQHDDDLEPFFRAARSQQKEPDSALLARVIELAEHEQSAQARAYNAIQDAPSSSFWQRWVEPFARFGREGGPLRALGGWPVATGFVAAACAGIWIGALPQSPVSTSGILVVSDATMGFGDWGETVAFGLTTDIAMFDSPSDNIVLEELE